MASQPISVKLGKGVSLLAFAQQFDKVDVVPFKERDTNGNETGNTYHRLVGYDALGGRTMVNMSSNLAEVQGKSTDEVFDYIQNNARSLQIVDTDHNTLILCKAGGDFTGGRTLKLG
jgi:hypothetical protein